MGRFDMAIRVLEGMVTASNNDDLIDALFSGEMKQQIKASTDAINTAISVLRNERRRDEGCKYCNTRPGDNPLTHPKAPILAYIQGRSIMVANDEMAYALTGDYCLRCGRELAPLWEADTRNVESRE